MNSLWRPQIRSTVSTCRDAGPSTSTARRSFSFALARHSAESAVESMNVTPERSRTTLLRLCPLQGLDGARELWAGGHVELAAHHHPRTAVDLHIERHRLLLQVGPADALVVQPLDGPSLMARSRPPPARAVPYRSKRLRSSSGYALRAWLLPQQRESSFPGLRHGPSHPHRRGAVSRRPPRASSGVGAQCR